MARRLFTSESVTEGHPDKIADQISDGDPRRPAGRRTRAAGSPSRRMITTGQVHVAGEVTTKAYADIPTDRPGDHPRASATTRRRRASTAPPAA